MVELITLHVRYIWYVNNHRAQFYFCVFNTCRSDKKGKKLNECYVLEPHVYRYSVLFTRLISFYVYMYAYWITYLLRK